MNREFELFITEDDAQVKKWKEQKEHDGSIIVLNTEGVIRELAKRTEPNDAVICRISGAWLEQCVEKSVRRLLNPVGYGNELLGRTISAVTVDLRTSVAWGDRELSIGDKRKLFTDGLGEKIAQDTRLTILP